MTRTKFIVSFDFTNNHNIVELVDLVQAAGCQVDLVHKRESAVNSDQRITLTVTSKETDFYKITKRIETECSKTLNENENTFISVDHDSFQFFDIMSKEFIYFNY